MTALAEHVAGKGLKLELTRVIKASKQRVFDAWTRPEFVRQWFGSAEKVCSAAEMEPRVGGAYMIEMKGPSCTGTDSGADPNRATRVTGRYIKLDPHDLLQFTWTGDWDPNEETLVTVALRDVEGGTEVKLTHERFQTEAARDQHEHGWMGALDKMVRLFETE